MKLRPPSHWECVDIGEIAEVIGGGTPASRVPGNFVDNGGIPWVTPADLSGYREQYIGRGARNLTEQGFKSCSARKMPAGTVLFSSRAPIGYVAIAKNELTTNQGFKSFVLPNGLESRFVYYYLRYIKPIAEQRATGTTFKELSGSAAARLPFLVAPEGEQKRIAEKLDTVLARVDVCQARLVKVESLIRRFRQSVLHAAVSGRLTEDWRDGQKYHTERIPFRDLVDDALVGLVCPASEQLPLNEDVTPYVKMNNVLEEWGYTLDGLVAVKCDATTRQRYELRIGDWLFNTRNSRELVGKSCVWNGGPAVYNNNLLRVRFNKRAHPTFIDIWFRSPRGRSTLESLKSATTSVAAIYQRSLMETVVQLPSTGEQCEIVRRVEMLFELADNLRIRLMQAQASIDRLTPALFTKAFRGELVRRDPNDEPAAELLKRLAKHRSVEDHATKGKRAKRAAPVVALNEEKQASVE